MSTPEGALPGERPLEEGGAEQQRGQHTRPPGVFDSHRVHLGVDPTGPPHTLEDLVMAHAHLAARTVDIHTQLADYLERLDRPAQAEAIVFKGSADPAPQAIVESREKVELPTLSIGVLNPTSLTVYFSPIGSATPAARAYSCPPNNMIVLPISAGPLELGVDPVALGANNAVCWLLRFFTVQAAFLGKGA